MAAKKEKTAKQIAAEEKVNSEKQRALDMALAGIEKQFGKGAIIVPRSAQPHIFEITTMNVASAGRTMMVSHFK